MTVHLEFELFKAWCKLHNLKPSLASSLEKYMEETK